MGHTERNPVELWPGVQLPVPAALRVPVRVTQVSGQQVLEIEVELPNPLSSGSPEAVSRFEERSRGWFAFNLALNGGSPDDHDLGGFTVPVPEELHLRGLMTLDLDSAEAIADFCNEHGLMRLAPKSLHWASAGDLELAPDVDRVALLDKRIAEINAWQTDEGASPSDIYIREACLLPEVLLSSASLANRLGQRPGYFAFDPDEFRVLAWQMRDMVRIWQAHVGDRPLAFVSGEWESRHWSRPTTWRDALRYLGTGLTEALTFVTPTVRFRENDTVRQPMTVWLYQALALRLYNDIASNEGYRTCRNEKCPLPHGLFSRQQGRAKYGQNWTNSQYCSPLCADQQKKRNRRRDQKLALELRADGLSVAEIAAEMTRRRVSDVPNGRPIGEEQVRRWLESHDKRLGGGTE